MFYDTNLLDQERKRTSTAASEYTLTSDSLHSCTILNMSQVYLLLPLALQPTVGFGLSNNVLPFFLICHQLSPSTHAQHLKISFYFLFPSFPGSSPSSRPFQFSSEDPPFSLGDLTSLSFALLSILLYFLLCSSLLVLDSSYFSIPRFHI